MNSEIYAEWLRRQDRRVVQTASGFWVEAGPHMFQAFPNHLLIEPGEDELAQLFYKEKALGVRFSAKWEAPRGAASYHVVYSKPEYPLTSLPKKARHDVTRGLKAGRVEPISFARLADEGWQLRQETNSRHGSAQTETQAWWRQLCNSTEGLPGFETWAVIINEQLAAALLAFTCEGCCNILYQQSRTNYLPLGVNNALIFAFANEVLNRPDKPFICYGIESLVAAPSVDEFKIRMGFTAQPVRQCVVFHPWLRPFFNQNSLAFLKRIIGMFPHSSSLVQAERMVRSYLAGQKPIQEQEWPELLKGG